MLTLVLLEVLWSRGIRWGKYNPHVSTFLMCPLKSAPLPSDAHSLPPAANRILSNPFATRRSPRKPRHELRSVLNEVVPQIQPNHLISSQHRSHSRSSQCTTATMTTTSITTTSPAATLIRGSTMLFRHIFSDRRLEDHYNLSSNMIPCLLEE